MLTSSVKSAASYARLLVDTGLFWLKSLDVSDMSAHDEKKNEELEA